MRRIHRLGLMLVSAATLLGCSSAPEKPAAPGMAFSQADKTSIVQYYTAEREKRMTQAPAPTQYKPGDVLQSGMRPNKLPIDLANRLADLPASYTRLIVGSDVILVNRDNHQIADVIPQIAY